MRVKHAKLFILLILFGNLILFYYTWKTFLMKTVLDSASSLSSSFDSGLSINQNTDDKIKLTKDKQQQQHQQQQQQKLTNNNNYNKHIKKSITIVFRNIFNFENDLKESIDSILEIIPNIHILIIQDSIPYPPIVYVNNATNTVKFFHYGFDINKTFKDLSPLLQIKTKFVLFMPDSVRINSKNLLQKILKDINGIGTSNSISSSSNVNVNGISNINSNIDIKKMIIVPFAGNLKSFSSCTKINLHLPNWTIEYVAVNSTENCDLYLQKHAILIDIDLLQDMPNALMSPFPEMFYIQAKIMRIKKKIYPGTFQDGKRLFTSYHTKQRRMEIRRKQFREMYKKLQIKRIIKRAHKISSKTEVRDNTNNPTHNIILEPQFSSSNFSLPLVTEIDLIGCERTTKSCVGPVYNQKPFYTYLKKHTPPCCLDKLKSVFYHLLDEFENVGIRYWLDNLGLKSAIDTNQLSPDAFDIDISFNAFDIDRSASLKKSQQRPFVDSDGFYWIKATDGQYSRIQFSKINQIGINLLPFELSGKLVKPYGFFGWKAKEFSIEFLHPMSTVLFLGKNVMCPNNVREYLEHKNIK